MELLIDILVLVILLAVIVVSVCINCETEDDIYDLD